MGIEHIQSNLSGGELAPALHARIDIDKYNTSVATAKNVVIVPQGGLRRRPGLAKITDSAVGEDARLIPFVFNKTQQYLLVYRAGYVDILRDGEIVKADVATPFSTMAIVDEVDIIQSADTIIMTHEDFAPRKMVRGATDADWTFSTISLTIPLHDFAGTPYRYENNGDIQEVYVKIGDVVWNHDGDANNGTDNNYYTSLTDTDTGTPASPEPRIDLAQEDFSDTGNWTNEGFGKEDVWSATRGYPAACTFHMGRLWFAGSTDKPTSVWGSRVSGFFDFTAQGLSGSIPDDHAIFDTIESDQYNKITNIFGGRGLQVFTTGAEYFNKIEIITPANSAWEAQTGYGSKGIRPVFIDGATLFVDSSERTIREFVYNFNEDAHVSNSITLLASHLFTEIVSMSAIKGTDIDVSDFVYIVNSDGTLAVMNTLRNESILGWTQWTTDGEFLDVCVVDKSVYFLVKRENEYFIEMLDEDSYTDHNVVYEGVATDEITTSFDSSLAAVEFKVIADYSMMPDDTESGGKFTISRDATRIEVGLNYDVEVTTLPLNTALQSGATLHRRKRIVKADVNVYESLGVYVRDIYASDRKFTVVLDEAPERFTGFRELYLLGYDRIVQLEITQENPLPLLIRAIGYTVEY